MGFLTDLIGSAIGTSQANKQYGRIAADYTSAENKSVAGFQPFADLGATGAARLQQMSTPGFAYSPQDPSYDWRFGQGVRAQDQGAAAHGDLQSGGEKLALLRYGQGYGSTEYANEFARNLQLSGQGLTAAGDQSNAYFNGAGGRAGAYSAQAGSNAGFWGGALASFNHNTDPSRFGFGG